MPPPGKSAKPTAQALHKEDEEAWLLEAAEVGDLHAVKVRPRSLAPC